MKAGIYKTPNGNLIYVAKDRTIKATTLSPSNWPGTKVSHRSSDDTVVIEDTDYRCTRFSDVPNGCTDPAKALLEASAALELQRRSDSLQDASSRIEREIKSGRVILVDGPVAATKVLERLRGVKSDAAVIDNICDGHAERISLGLAAKGLLGEHRKAHPDVAAAAPKMLMLEGVDVATNRISIPVDGPAGHRRVFSALDDLDQGCWRLCHKRSARKHRKRGDEVQSVPMVPGWFMWRKAS